MENNSVIFSKVIEVNPRRTLKKGEKATFIDMKSVEPFTRKVIEMSTREFNRSGSKFRNGDTIFARITPCLENGKTAFIDNLVNFEIAFGSTEFIVFSGKEGISDNMYVYYLLRAPEIREYAIKNMVGTSGRQRVDKSCFDKLEIVLPCLEQQRRIASILSSLDDKIELNNEMNKTLEEMAQAVFKSWFVDFEPFKDGEFEESELGMIPKGWNVGKVGDICDVSSSKRIFMADYKETGIPFYRGKEIIEKSKGNEVSTEIYVDIDKFTGIKSKFGSPTKGDILLTSVGTIGIPYLVKDEEFYFKDGNLTWFKNFKVNGYNLYIYYWIKYGEGKNNIDKITIGSTQKALTISSLKDMKIVIPSDEGIYKFSSYVSTIVNRYEANINETLYLKSIRDTLLPKLISGEIKL